MPSQNSSAPVSASPPTQALSLFGTSGALNYKTLAPSYFPDYLAEPVKLFSDGAVDQALSSLLSIESKMAGNKRFDRDYPDKFFFLKGLTLQGLNQHPKAVEAFQKSLSLRGSNSDVLYHLALSQSALKQDTLALANFQESAWFSRSTLVPKELPYFRSAQLYLSASPTPQLTEARNALNVALLYNPNFSQARVQLSLASIEGGDKPKALSLLRDQLQKTPDDPEIKLNLGRTLLVNVNRAVNQADIAEANKIADELLDPTKELPSLLDQEVIQLKIRALIENGDIDKADEILVAELKKTPTSADLLQIKNQIAVERDAKKRVVEVAALNSPTPTPTK